MPPRSKCRLYLLHPLVIHVTWHPDFGLGGRTAEQIRKHFGSKRFRNVLGGIGIEVVFQSTLGSEAPNPRLAALEAGSSVAAVAMMDACWVDDPEWVRHLDDLGKTAAAAGFHARLFPVVMEPSVLDQLKLREQGIRWDQWDAADEPRERRLIRELAYEFARMLRHRLDMLRRPRDEVPQLERYARKIQTFISHSKHDDHGRDIAEAIRRWLHENSALAGFLDVHDIPAGLPFDHVIEHHIGRSVMLVIHTDSYSSREWCRREVLKAKRERVPMIVVDCLNVGEERAFPYLGNVPVVRMNPVANDRLPEVAARLLDEVLADFLWRCRVEALPTRPHGTVFMSRPPELISLATLPAAAADDNVVVHPDPPLDAEEAHILQATWSDLRVQSMSQWMPEEPS